MGTRRDGSVRRRIEFDDATFAALDRLAKDRMQTLQELVEEAFRDLLKKHRRPTTPNSLVVIINHERMPVLLTREEEFETWLRASAAEALALEREYPPQQMRQEKEDLLKAA